MGFRNDFIRFVEQPGAAPKSGKTKVWLVETSDGRHDLGVVSWFGRWRGYAFHPHPETVFERRCLRRIADFIEERNDEQRVALQDARRELRRIAGKVLDKK